MSFNPVSIEVNQTVELNAEIKKLSCGMFSINGSSSPYAYGETVPYVEFQNANLKTTFDFDLGNITTNFVLNVEDIPEEITVRMPILLASYIRRGKFSPNFIKKFKSTYVRYLATSGKISLELPEVNIKWLENDDVFITQVHTLESRQTSIEKLFAMILVLHWSYTGEIFCNEMDTFLKNECTEMLNG